MSQAVLNRPTTLDPLTSDPGDWDERLLVFFIGRWPGLLALAAKEAVRLGKSPEEAGHALAFAVGAQLEGSEG